MRCTGTTISRGRTSSCPNTAVGAARDLDGRQDVDDPHQARHLLRRRPGVQGQEARAHRRRLRVFVEARPRSEDALATRCRSFDGRFVGMDALVAKAKETGKFDYDAPIEGPAGRSTATRCSSSSTSPTYELLSNLTTVAAAAVAREVVEAYGDASGWVMANPVGTGPYRLKEWRRGQKIVLEANPDLPRRALSGEQRSRPTRRSSRSFKGKKLPLIGRIEISIIEEATRGCSRSSRASSTTSSAGRPRRQRARPGNKLKPRFAEAASRCARHPARRSRTRSSTWRIRSSAATRTDKIALRRAIGMAYNVDEEIRVIRQGQAMPATQVVPPSVSGHDPKFVGTREIRSRRRQGAARPLRLHGPRQRRLARPARRQAAGAARSRPHRPRSTASTTSCGSAA